MMNLAPAIREIIQDYGRDITIVMNNMTAYALELEVGKPLDTIAARFGIVFRIDNNLVDGALDVER